MVAVGSIVAGCDPWQGSGTSVGKMRAEPSPSPANSSLRTAALVGGGPLVREPYAGMLKFEVDAAAAVGFVEGAAAVAVELAL